VRALARSPERVDQALAALACGRDVEVVEGDVTERDHVRAALTGCDGVVHAAAVYSLDPRFGGFKYDGRAAPAGPRTSTRR